MVKYFVRYTGAILGTLRAEYRQIMNRYFGTTERFEGNAKQICGHIIDKLWEGDFYRTSLGHFDFFWMRDFGTVCQSLVNIGYIDRVHHTLCWALDHYRRAGVVTLCIDKAGNTFNAPARKSVDALPWLLHSLVVSDYPLSLEERAFLDHQLEVYIDTFLDRKTGRLRKMRFAEMRDAVYYDRSAYAVALVARLAHVHTSCIFKHFLFTRLNIRQSFFKNIGQIIIFGQIGLRLSLAQNVPLYPFF